MHLSGFWSSILDSIKQIAGDIGVADPAIITAVARAFAEPSLGNINAVTAAYAARGTTPPPELMNALYDRYRAGIKTTPPPTGQWGGLTQGNIMPWLVLGGLGLILLTRRR